MGCTNTERVKNMQVLKHIYNYMGGRGGGKGVSEGVTGRKGYYFMHCQLVTGEGSHNLS